jgi:threonine/homoserine/homoserine lactone efflux protein
MIGIPLETITLFLAASVALALAPGPDNLFVLTQSALYGRASGLMVTLGLCTGLLVHTTAVAIGVAVLFQTSAVAFNTLKFLGAGYLVYLAWQAFRADASDLSSTAATGRKFSRLYVRGIVMNITNPKVAIFFLAFLPQFADPGRGPMTAQLLLFGALFIVVAFLTFGAISWGGGSLGEWLRKSTRAQRVMNQVAGTVFVALALKLVLTER